MQVLAAATSASHCIPQCRVHIVTPKARLVASPLAPFLSYAFTKRHYKSTGSMRRSGAVVQANYGSQWATPPDAYVTLGLAHCFEKNDEGRVMDRFVIEPISANSLECMANGARTSFKHVFGLTLQDAISRNRQILPDEFHDGIFCEEFEERADSCARTWMRPHAIDNLLDIVPLGQLRSSFNYDTTDKRVLNTENVVNDSDNIKQDMSIDVYGRKEEKEESTASEKKEEDDLDTLLAA